MHVNAEDFFTPPKRVTSPPWGPPTPCKQALIPELWEDNGVNVSKKTYRYNSKELIIFENNTNFTG